MDIYALCLATGEWKAVTFSSSRKGKAQSFQHTDPRVTGNPLVAQWQDTTVLIQGAPFRSIVQPTLRYANAESLLAEFVVVCCVTGEQLFTTQLKDFDMTVHHRPDMQSREQVPIQSICSSVFAAHAMFLPASLSAQCVAEPAVGH